MGVNKSIYVFGGYTDRHKEVTYLDTAARFDTLTGSWTFLSPMEYARSGGQVHTVDNFFERFVLILLRDRSLTFELAALNKRERFKMGVRTKRTGFVQVTQS